MPAFPRDEIEEMVRRWVAANDEAGRSGDWSKMSAFYTEDALYSWNNGANWEFVARNRQQIHDWVFGTEMAGLEHWTYPYVRTLIDDQKGEFIALEDARRVNRDGSGHVLAFARRAAESGGLRRLHHCAARPGAPRLSQISPMRLRGKAQRG